MRGVLRVRALSRCREIFLVFFVRLVTSTWRWAPLLFHGEKLDAVILARLVMKFIIENTLLSKFYSGFIAILQALKIFNILFFTIIIEYL